jgi:hypothetical protein
MLTTAIRQTRLTPQTLIAHRCGWPLLNQPFNIKRIPTSPQILTEQLKHPQPLPNLLPSFLKNPVPFTAPHNPILPPITRPNDPTLPLPEPAVRTVPHRHLRAELLRPYLHPLRNVITVCGGGGRPALADLQSACSYPPSCRFCGRRKTSRSCGRLCGIGCRCF